MLSPNCRTASISEAAAVSSELYAEMAELATDPLFDTLPQVQGSSKSGLRWDGRVDDLAIMVSKDVPFGNREVPMLDGEPTLISCRTPRLNEGGTFQFYLENGELVLEQHPSCDSKLTVAELLKRLGTTANELPSVIGELTQKPIVSGSCGVAAIRMRSDLEIFMEIDTSHDTPEHEIFQSHDGLVICSLSPLNMNFRAQSTDGSWNKETVTVGLSDLHNYSGLVGVSMRTLSTGALRGVLAPKGRLLKRQSLAGRTLRAGHDRELDVTYATMTAGRLHEVYELGKEVLARTRVDLEALKFQNLIHLQKLYSGPQAPAR